MIRSFGDAWTKELFNDEVVNRLNDLAVPPSNRLEKLQGRLKDFHSIRVNDQWRIIFRWIEGEAHEVQLLDYHR